MDGHHQQRTKRFLRVIQPPLDKDKKRSRKMNGVLFLALWITCATLHTIYDLKVKPIVQRKLEEWGENSI